MTTRELTRIAFIGAILYTVFHVFSHVLYLEMITFTILVASQIVSQKEIVLACVVFSLIQILLNGLMPWNIAYLIIYPSYGFIFFKSRSFLKAHASGVPFYGAFFSFLTGQLVDLPFMVFSKTITILYVIMGLKTSLIQAGITFLVILFLYEPVYKVLHRMMKSK